MNMSKKLTDNCTIPIIIMDNLDNTKSKSSVGQCKKSVFDY